MSSPKNHHYVSQCHQKEFFNDEVGLIYLYDKELDNYYYKSSTKRLFSKDHLNTKERNGELDQVTLEKELKILTEDNFIKNVSKVKQFLNDQNELQQTYEALFCLTILGILGEFRHPQFKESLDETMLKFESDYFLRIYNFDKEKVKKYLKNKQKTSHSNILSYISIAFQILEKMEPLDFMIYSIKSNDHFLLPDTSCFQLRGQLKNYPNPFVQEIIQVGIPLTDKLFILATPQSLKTELHGIQFINDDDSNLVYKINKDLYMFAKKAVACKDEDYLKNIIEKFKKGCT